jgi:hypothetical protein
MIIALVKEGSDMTINKCFTITDLHLKLAKRMYVSWDDAEFGAPCIDPKRPYGNGDVIEDIKEIIGSECDKDFAIKIHKEMETALQIFLCTQSFKAGTYRMADKYKDLSWKAMASENNPPNYHIVDCCGNCDNAHYSVTRCKLHEDYDKPIAFYCICDDHKRKGEGNGK